MRLTVAQAEEVAKALLTRGTGKVCAACNHDAFTLSQFLNVLITAGGEACPTICVACDHCGLVRQFLLTPLGLGHLVAPPPKEGLQ